MKIPAKIAIRSPNVTASLVIRGVDSMLLI
jgi:hypothetical protein